MNVHHRNRIGQTALHYQDEKISECLLGFGADVDAHDDDKETPLRKAVQQKAQPKCCLLLRHGADPSPLFKPISECRASGQTDYGFYEHDVIEILKEGGYTESAIKRLFEEHGWSYPS